MKFQAEWSNGSKNAAQIEFQCSLVKFGHSSKAAQTICIQAAIHQQKQRDASVHPVNDSPIFESFQSFKKENKSNTLIHSASARLGIHTARIFLPWAQPQMIEFCWHLTKIKDVLLNLVVPTGDSSIRAHFTARKCSVSCYKGIIWYVYQILSNKFIT